MIPDILQNQTSENDGRIDAFQGIDGAHDFHGPHCKYLSTIKEGTSTLNVDDFNNEDEVNFETLKANISDINQELPIVPSSLTLVNIPLSKTNNHQVAPICSFMFGLSPRIT